MAHLRNLIIRRCQTCGTRATVQLFGIRNAEYGYYCKRHGDAACRDLARRENQGEHPNR